MGGGYYIHDLGYNGDLHVTFQFPRNMVLTLPIITELYKSKKCFFLHSSKVLYLTFPWRKTTNVKPARAKNRSRNPCAVLQWSDISLVPSPSREERQSGHETSLIYS